MKKNGEVMGNFKTVFAAAQDETVIEKSRFIGYCKPIESEEDATAFIEQIKKKHWDATHNVPVYVLGENYQVQRYSDDGEPSGTAGVPILSMLKAEGITNVCVVVTRYFGGVKLGTGGLVRAYTHTAKLGLEASIVIDKVLNQFWSVTLDYTQHGKVQNYLLGESRVIIDETLFTDLVVMNLYTAPDEMDSIQNKLIDLTNGQAQFQNLGQAYLSISNGEILEKTIF